MPHRPCRKITGPRESIFTASAMTHISGDRIMIDKTAAVKSKIRFILDPASLYILSCIDIGNAFKKTLGYTDYTPKLTPMKLLSLSTNF